MNDTMYEVCESVRVKLEDAQASDKSEGYVVKNGSRGEVRDRSTDGGFRYGRGGVGGSFGRCRSALRGGSPMWHCNGMRAVVCRRVLVD